MIYLGDYSRVWNEKTHRFVRPDYVDHFMTGVVEEIGQAIDVRTWARDDAVTIANMFSDFHMEQRDLQHCHLENPLEDAVRDAVTAEPIGRKRY